MKTTSTNASRNVGFNKVEMFEFPYTIGDSPSVTSGAPLAMGPCHQNRYFFDFHEYEKAKITLPRRSKQQMMMDAELRTRILLNCGYSLSRIFEAAAAAEKARKLRHESATSSATAIALNEARTMARRKMQSFVGKSIRRRSFSNIDKHSSDQSRYKIK